MITIITIVWWVLFAGSSCAALWSGWESYKASQSSSDGVVSEAFVEFTFTIMLTLFAALAWFTLQALKECVHVF